MIVWVHNFGIRNLDIRTSYYLYVTHQDYKTHQRSQSLVYIVSCPRQQEGITRVRIPGRSRGQPTMKED